GADHPATAAGSAAVMGADPISRNEPGDPATEHALVPVEPVIAGDDPGPQPEPACPRCRDGTPGQAAHARGAARAVEIERALPGTAVRSVPSRTAADAGGADGSSDLGIGTVWS